VTQKLTDHNGFPIDDVPPRLGALPPVSVYKAQPVRITGLDPTTGKTITVVANRIASGPDGKPFTFAEASGAPRASRILPKNIVRRSAIADFDDYGDDMSAVNEAAILRTRK
jgi:hypothetical protein